MPNSTNLRIISFKTNISKIAEYENSNYMVEHNNIYTIITNLDDKTYNDKVIEEIYASGWNIEVFFIRYD